METFLKKPTPLPYYNDPLLQERPHVRKIEPQS